MPPKSVQNIVDAASSDIAADGQTLVGDGTAGEPQTTDVLRFLNGRVAQIYSRLGMAVPRYVGQTSSYISTSTVPRTVDLATPPSGKQEPEAIRIITIDGNEIFIVDEEWIDEKIAPRAFLRERVLVEVGTEWDAVSPAAKTVIVLHARQPARFDETSSFAQNVDLPDDWVIGLIAALKGYIAEIDGRPQEADRFNTAAEAWLGDLITHMENLDGPETTLAPAEESGA